MFKELKHIEMRKKLNMNKKEHDIVFLKPHHKTIGHLEVKAMLDQQSGEVKKALSQLKGGKEEMARAHGHTLDEQWRYLGVICLPKLSSHLKEKICMAGWVGEWLHLASWNFAKNPRWRFMNNLTSGPHFPPYQI